ncbi:MAG: M28 family peptidase [Lentisphaeria bacterium]
MSAVKRTLPNFILACLCGIALLGCGGELAGDSRERLAFDNYRLIDGLKVLRLTEEFLSVGPRPSGSPGAAKAAGWIAKELEARDLTPKVCKWQENTPRGKLTFRNVIAVSPGAKPGRIILASHYDTKRLPQYPEFAGANDSGSSTALLLAVAAVLTQVPPAKRCTFEFAFFDGEECIEKYGPSDGLHGSQHYAEKIKAKGMADKYRAMILMDMIGDRDLRVTIPPTTPKHLTKLLFEVARNQNVRNQFGYFVGGNILDDHVPFAKLGIPSINLIDFEFGPDNSFWHTPEDSLDKLSAASLETVGNVVVELTLRLAVKSR